jgi:hypothetical protein
MRFAFTRNSLRHSLRDFRCHVRRAAPDLA